MANGEIERVVIDVVERPIPPELTTPDLLENEELRTCFRTWFESIWREKDEKLAACGLRCGSGAPPDFFTASQDDGHGLGKD